MLGILGAILIIASCTGLGFLYREKEIRRIKELEVLCYTFRIIKSEIILKNQPLPYACQTAGMKVRRNEGKILLKIAETMEMQEGENFSKVWEDCWKSYLEHAALSGEERRRILEFCSFNGYDDSRLQTDILEEEVGQLGRQYLKAKEELERKQKVILVLSSFGGIILTLILL